MSRQEDFKNKRNEYVDSYCYENEITSAEMVDAIDETFDDAAEYGYLYAVEKACEWLMNNVNDYIINDIYLVGDWYKVKSEMFDNFRKAMEQ